MCGIAGWISKGASGGAVNGAVSQHEVVLKRMADTISHRGPDGEGFVHEEGVAFAHRRLAILDIDGGKQPMFSHDERFLITYNGEIYNYQELRSRLLEQGHQFRTQSDTEVILEMFRRDGMDCLGQLRGMFAFALWDRQSGRTWLVRDNFGIKPLFYFENNSDICFASEAKAILEKYPECRQLDYSSMHMVMNFRYLPGEASLFPGVRQLAPGHYLEWDGTEAKIRQYGTAEKPSGFGSILEAAEDSVKRHLVSDVEVGCYLSGGLDSACITALAKKQQNLRTFSLDIGDDPGELENARETAQLLGVENISGHIEIDANADLEKCIWHLEVPKVNALQVYTLSRYAAESVKVVLSGLGGDELFVGYNMHKYFMWREPVKNKLTGLQKLSGNLVSVAGSFLHQEPWSEFQRIGEILKSNNSGPAVYGLLRNCWHQEDLSKKIYGPRMLDQKLPSPFDYLEDSWPGNANDLKNFLDLEWKGKMVNDLLWQEDRCSMAHGLESRVPFVDQEMKHFVSGLSVDELCEFAGKKQLKGKFRSELGSLLPAEVLNRPKSGFQVDSPEFFHQYLEELAAKYLSPEMIAKHGFFNPEFVKDILRRPRRTRLRWHYFILYLMIGFHIWAETFL